MKNPVFTGAGVAIITPMYEDGSINFDELGRIVEDQIARGTDAIVICGTTGECSTMTDEEQLAAIKYTVDLVNHRVPVIAGAGSNDTDHGCALAAKSAACGADALLLVTPYYNKTSQAGLVAHFTAMAEAGGIPVILYNVPSRTGLNIAPETAKELSRHPLINGIKEASGNIGQVAKIAALCGDELNIYSGNDDQIVPMMSLGAKGVISVLSNVAPKETHDIVALYNEGKVKESCDLQLKALPLIHALFSEVNPIPVKKALNLMGKEVGPLRGPLSEMEEEHAAKLAEEGGYDYFTTTLSISPLKNAAKINEIGQELAEIYHVQHLPSDFKKKNGYKRSIELSHEYDLYRQNYCGCVYSRREAENRK